MTTSEDRADRDAGAIIDRLVDGELPEDERRHLLLRLENEPDGWRRCALAFLEDQALRKALAGSSCLGTRTTPDQASPRVPRPGRDWLRRASIAATVIGSTFAAGFSVGLVFKAAARAEVAKGHQGRPVEPVATPPSGEIREVGSFRLVDGSGGESSTRRFPILAGPGLTDQWLRKQPPSVPDYVRARWERQGYQVEQRRNLVSVELEDGRRVAIPVDEVDVAYVGQKPL